MYLVEILRHRKLTSVATLVQEDIMEAIVAVTELGHAECACVDHRVVVGLSNASTKVLEKIVKLRLRFMAI